MNRQDIEKTWEVYQSVVEKSKKAELDPVGKADADIDNDDDVDDTDVYLKNRRKAIKTSKMDEDTTDGVAPGSLDNDGHLCASRIFKAGVGEGTPVMGEHAEPDADGFIAWYNVDFDNGISGSVEMVDEGVVVLAEMSHGSHKKKKMKKESVEQVDEIKIPSNYGAMVARAKKKKFMAAQKAAKAAKTSKAAKESVEQVDELSRNTLNNYMSKASDAQGHRKLSNKKVDNRYAGVKMADEKQRKRDGYSSSAKVAAREEVEQVDEISQRVKNRYIKKAAMSAASNANSDGTMRGIANKKQQQYHKDQVMKRLKGIGRATKEEVEQTDEIQEAKASRTDSNGNSTDQEFVNDLAKAIVEEGNKKHRSVASAYVEMLEKADADRAKHYKGATKPEGHLDTLPQSQQDFIKSLSKDIDVEDEEQEIAQDAKSAKKAVKASPAASSKGSEPIAKIKDTTKKG